MAELYGVNTSTFHAAGPNPAHKAHEAWISGAYARLPGRGVLYSKSPDDEPPVDLYSDSLDAVFLGPQSDSIITGDAWGLMVSYRCNIVERLDDLSLYPLFEDIPDDKAISEWMYAPKRENEAGSYFRSWNYNSTHWWRPTRLLVATSITSGVTSALSYTPSIPVDLFDTYANGGFSRPAVMEAILWQDVSFHSGKSKPFLDHGPTVEGLTDTGPALHAFNQSRFGPLPEGKSFPAVAARCTSQSALGYATLNGFTKSWSNFRPTAPSLDRTSISTHDTLELGAYRVFTQNPGSLELPCPPPTKLTGDRECFDSLGFRWLSSVFREVVQTSDPVPLVQGMTAQDLRLSMLRSYGAYASQLMYHGRWSTVDNAAQALTWRSENVTGAERDHVLVKGRLGAIPVVLLLGVWALGCVVLIVVFGLGPRGAETVDAYSAWRFGVGVGLEGLVEGKEMPLEMERCAVLVRLNGVGG